MSDTDGIAAIVSAVQDRQIDDDWAADSRFDWRVEACGFLADLRRLGWDVTCIECGHVAVTDVPIQHHVTVSDGTPESGQVVCLWACGHTVERDRPCRCAPAPAEPF